MYVRDAKNRDEVWLLDHIEAMDLDDTAFRSRDYVIAVDEDSDTRAGFGRIRIHKRADDPDVCELTSVGVLDGWRRQGVGAHVIERLVQHAADQDFETVYAITTMPAYLGEFGFEPVDPVTLPSVLAERLTARRQAVGDPDTDADGESAVVPMRLLTDRFRMPDRLRERFKTAAEQATTAPEERPEDFGIDPDEATYKYDTG